MGLERTVDVAVIGGGLAGLTAARQLHSDGLEVVVVEARDRVGGRTLNHPIGDDKIVEVGGQWVGPGQDRVLALIDELGLETFPTYTDGRHLFEHRGKLRRYRGRIPLIAATPIDYIEKDWSADEWTRGCYGAFMPPNTWTEYGSALRAPVGRIHWTGAETATIWMGYMDGGHPLGERAAAEITALVRTDRKPTTHV